MKKTNRSRRNRTTARYAVITTSAMILGLVLAIALIGCNRPGQGRDESEAEEPSFAVAIEPVSRGEIVEYIEVNGDVETTSTVDVFPETAGTLTTVSVRIGDRVQLNQVLAEVDPSRPGQRFAPSPVRAPIAGTVTSLPARVGATVGQGTSIARIATTEELQIRTAIPERFIAKIGLDQRAEVRLAAYPDHRFQARVTELSPVVDPRTRTMETVLGFVRPDSRIRAGMFAQIRLILNRRSDAVLLPVSSVVRRAGDTFVFVLDDRDDETRAVRRDIRTGIQSGGRLEVLEGVAEGEFVVVQGQNLLEDGALVRIVAGRESRE